MYTFENTNFDIRQIALSGQCFRMTEIYEGLWQIISKDKCITLSQNKSSITLSCNKEEFDSYWKAYFDLNYDYSNVISSIDRHDSYLTSCADFGSGIRILKQDLWEMLITFMISQNNNIPRIKSSVKRLCEYAGERKTILIENIGQKGNILKEALEYYTFPTPEALSMIPVDTLHSFGLGYRDEYLHLAALKTVSGEFNLENLKNLSYNDALKILMSLKGVGKKVADCVCLFGLHHIEAFPIDTHIKQIFAEHYPEGFPFEKYEGYAGILQQYMFFAHL